MEEFKKIGWVLLLDIDEFSSSQGILTRCFPRIFNSTQYKKFSNMILSKKFDIFIDIILFLNAFVVILQSYPQLLGHIIIYDSSLRKNWDQISDWNHLDLTFTAFFFVEMTCKIIVLGIKKYWSNPRNFFDGIITLITITATSYALMEGKKDKAEILHFIVMGRVLRLLRVLFAVEQFENVGNVITSVLDDAWRIIVFLMCVMYIFAAAGMYYYGGLITRDPSSPLSYLLKGTDFANSCYWANNFNDMLSGINVLFNLLVVNNWTEMADGIQAVSGSTSKLFFLAFHILVVIIVNNCVIALIIDSFLDEWEYQKKKKSCQQEE